MDKLVVQLLQIQPVAGLIIWVGMQSLEGHLT